MADNISALLDNLNDAMLAREDSCHPRATMADRKEALAQWYKTLDAVEAALSRPAEASEPMNVLNTAMTLEQADTYDAVTNVAASEPVACNRKACRAPLPSPRWWNTSTRAYYCHKCMHAITRWPENAGIFEDRAHPSAAGVTVTEAMVDRAVEVYMNTTSTLTPSEYREMQPDNFNMMWCGLRDVLTATTAASEVQP